MTVEALQWIQAAANLLIIPGVVYIVRLESRLATMETELRLVVARLRLAEEQ